MTKPKIYPPPLPIVRALQPSRLLTAAQFQGLADVPPEIEWFANLGNAATRRSYENALKDFMRFIGIVKPDAFRAITGAFKQTALKFC